MIAAFVLLSAATTAAPASGVVFAGPVLDQNESGWDAFGLQIRADADVLLVSVRVPNQGLSDTIELRDSADTLLTSVAMPAGDTDQIVQIGYPLAAAQEYRLFATTPSNRRWAAFDSFPAGNGHLTVLSSWGAPGGASGSPRFGFWAAFNDITTTQMFCGDGSIDAGEQCDDGNTDDGDCCDSTCQYETSGSPCPDDGNPCTADTCDGTGSCGQLPTGCRVPGKSLLLLKNHATDDAKDTLIWKWLKGAETSLEDLGLPTGTTTYTLCLYAGSASAVVAVPAGAKWQPAGSKGYKLKDPTGTPDGAQKAVLKSGDAGKAKALVKGKGANLPDALVPPLALPVTAQLINDATSTCFEATYDTALKNDAKQFKARTP